MILPHLIPRLNYHFGFTDLLYSLKGLINQPLKIDYINNLYLTDKIYYLNHARSGLRLLLSSLSLPQNARIGVQVYNCRTVFNAIRMAGCTPIFIDINQGLHINIRDLEKKINSIDALIVTHTFGIPAEIEQIKELFPDKPIIEDCAHAFLSSYNNKAVGTFGDAGVFSIGKGKFPSIGPGGFVVINNQEVANKFEKLYKELAGSNNFQEIKNIIFSLVLNLLHKPFIYAIFTNSLLRKLNNKKDISDQYKHSESRILKTNYYLLYKKQNEFYNKLSMQKSNLNKLLESIYGCNPPKIYLDHRFSINGFMLPMLSDDSSETIIKLKTKGFEVGRHFSNSINWAIEFGYKQGDCPIIENIIDKIVVFPCHHDYSTTQKLIEMYENPN